MVKVLLFPIFDAQQVVSTDDEPVELADVGASFLLATRQGQIIKYDHGAESVPVHSFKTVNSSILSLEYAPSTDSIVTLEKDSDQSAINVVRVYSSWRGFLGPLPVVIGSPLDPSHPSYVLSSSSGVTAPAFVAVAKIVAPSSITCLAVCPMSGRVAVATKSAITLWRPASLNSTARRPPVSVDSHEQQFTVEQTMERMLEIDVLNATHLALHDQYFAYSTDREVKVFWLDMSEESDPSRSGSRALGPSSASVVNAGFSSMADDPHFLEIVFDSSGNLANNFQLANIQSSTQTADGGSFERLGPIADSDVSVVLERDTSGPDSCNVYGLTLLVHRRFDLSMDSPIHSVSFVPEYPLREVDVRGELHTPRSSEVVSMRFFVSTARQGFLYNVTAPHRPSVLCSYSYTTESIHCTASSSFLYAITTTGLETWTLRPSDAMSGEVEMRKKERREDVAPTAVEVPAPKSTNALFRALGGGGGGGGHNTTAVVPAPSSTDTQDDAIPSPLLIGLQPFISLQRIVVLRDGVLLLSKIKPPEGGKSKPSHSRGMSSPTIPSPNAPSANSSARQFTLIGQTPKTPPAPVATTPAAPVKGPRVGEAWSLYVLHHTPIPTLYKDMAASSQTYQDSNTLVYYQLLLEAHFLLYSGICTVGREAEERRLCGAEAGGGLDAAVALNLSVQASNYNTLLRSSSILLGNYYLQAQQYLRAAYHYAHSSLSVGDVVRRFLAHSSGVDSERSRTGQTSPVRSGLSKYLDWVLFNQDTPDLEEDDMELANKVLAHYHNHAPHRLSSVVLDSSLSSYSQSEAVRLLREQLPPPLLIAIAGLKTPLSRTIKEKIMGASAVNFDEKGVDKDLFAMALLYIDQDQWDDALSAFAAINPQNLVDFCVGNPKLLAPDGEEHDHDPAAATEASGEGNTPASASEDAPSQQQQPPQEIHVPPLGRVLRVCAPFALLEILVRQGGVIPIPTALAMLTKAEGAEDVYHHPDHDMDNILAKCYIEYVLLHVPRDFESALSPHAPSCEVHNMNCDSRRAGHKRGADIHHPSPALVASLVHKLAKMYLEDVVRQRGVDAPLFASMGENEDPSGAVTVTRWAASPGLHVGGGAAAMMLRAQEQPHAPYPPSGQSSFGIRWRRFHRKALVRPPDWKWLDRLPPFAAAPTIDESGKPPRSMSGSGSVPRSPHMGRSPSVASLAHMDEDDTFDYHFVYLRKMQGLITTCNREECKSLFDLMSNMREPAQLASMRLMCMPLVGQLDKAVDLLVDTYPTVSLEYAKHFCSLPADWSALLSALLQSYQRLAREDTTSSSFEKATLYRDVYESHLEHLTNSFDPSIFLSLLPEDGLASYYLPFIERVFARQQAKTLSNNVLSFMRMLEAEERHS
eukprot:TRINITY_DN5687_c0_g1_i1.p1 TRINITY_DN5687_c0_g1~~TRINITY_DN5687_c0_g1_i1.p1  ORF type:complete len:1375 (+),score=293.83 TRINITY_DN5687_c0_g1_i1:29-4153(+)